MCPWSRRELKARPPCESFQLRRRLGARWRRNFLAAAQLTEAMIVRGHRVAAPSPRATDRGERGVWSHPRSISFPLSSLKWFTASLTAKFEIGRTSLRMKASPLFPHWSRAVAFRSFSFATCHEKTHGAWRAQGWNEKAPSSLVPRLTPRRALFPFVSFLLAVHVAFSSKQRQSVKHTCILLRSVRNTDIPRAWLGFAVLC